MNTLQKLLSALDFPYRKNERIFYICLKSQSVPSVGEPTLDLARSENGNLPKAALRLPSFIFRIHHSQRIAEMIHFDVSQFVMQHLLSAFVTQVLVDDGIIPLIVWYGDPFHRHWQRDKVRIHTIQL